MAETTNPALQENTPYQQAFDILKNILEFYEIKTRFKLANVEGTTQDYLKKQLWGRAGNQFVFVAAHIALNSANSEEVPPKFMECLKKAKENYEKYAPRVIEKYRGTYTKRIEGLTFLIANPELAFKAEVDVLTKRGRLKPATALNVVQ